MLMQKRQSTIYDDNSDNESGDEYEERDDFGSHHQTTTTTTTTPIMTDTDHKNNNHVHHGHYTHNNNMLIDVASDDYDELISKSLQLSSFTISSTPSSVVERSTTSQYIPNHQYHHHHQPVVPQFSYHHHHQQTEQQQQYGYYPSSSSYSSSQVEESYGGVTTNYAPFASTHHDSSTTMTTPTYIHNITPSSSSLYTNIYNPILNHQLHHSGHNELEQLQQDDNKPFIYPNLSQFVNEEYHEQQDVQFYEMMDRSILVHANPSAPLEYLISVDHTNETTMTTTTTATTMTVKEDEKSKNVEQGEEGVTGTIYMTTEEFYKMKQQTEKQGEVAEKRLPAYLYHTLRPDDTLIGIAIGYGITEEQLKMTNNILTELEYFGKPRLLIPHPNRIPDQSLIKEDTESKAKLAEEKKQEWAIKFFVRLKGVSLEEAHYYLSLHEFDLRGAVTEYDADVKWQREYETRKRLKAERKRLEKGDKWSMLDTGKKLLSLLRLCVPIAQEKTSKFIPYSTTRKDDDPYGDLELDEIEENDDDVLDGGDVEQYDAHYPVMHAVNSP